jgi:hypothetical protein
MDTFERAGSGRDALNVIQHEPTNDREDWYVAFTSPSLRLVASWPLRAQSAIYYGEDGFRHGWVTVGIKDDGSPDRRHRMGKSETDVTRKIAELERKRDQGSAGKPGRTPTVADWL